MPGVLFEGGSFRAIFSCGVMDALLDQDVMFPYCIGVSAGAADSASYISRQKERNLNMLLRYRNDKRYMGLRNYFKKEHLGKHSRERFIWRRFCFSKNAQCFVPI